MSHTETELLKKSVEIQVRLTDCAYLLANRNSDSSSKSVRNQVALGWRQNLNFATAAVCICICVVDLNDTQFKNSGEDYLVCACVKN